MKATAPSEDRFYKLNKKTTPLVYILPTRSTKYRALLHFDGTVNRAIRYARNQKSPFEDEQDGNLIMEPVVFNDGFLSVPKNNPVLQQFLAVHPDNGRTFVEVDKERDAEAELQYMEMEAEAISMAKGLSLQDVEKLTRVILGRDPERYTVPEMKRDLMMYAKRNPEEFLEVYENPEMDDHSNVALMLSKKVISLRNSNRDVHYNLPGNKKRMLAVPFGEDPKSAIVAYFKTDKGIESMKILEKYMEEV
jgi:hypothetical protein